MAKIAKLVITTIITRVIVEDNATAEDIINAAKPKVIETINNDLIENVDDIIDDTECPYNMETDGLSINDLPKLEESNDDRILVENGDMFDGSRDQFADCFFSNATNEQISDWCRDNDWKLSINGQKII
ncbi:MAG TPA: hypothetical protein VFF27_07135 [Bacteroidia bacterium]|jgi:hypothetical protein|nr:hypothetical protein [Bacteroidia bacterium]